MIRLKDYQQILFDLVSKRKRLCAIWPRRSGKDVAALTFLVEQASKEVGIYFYVFPTYCVGRKVLFHSIIPELFQELDVDGKNLIINLKNGSTIEVIIFNNLDLDRNPKGIVISEIFQHLDLSTLKDYKGFLLIIGSGNQWLDKIYRDCAESDDWSTYYKPYMFDIFKKSKEKELDLFGIFHKHHDAQWDKLNEYISALKSILYSAYDEVSETDEGDVYRFNHIQDIKNILKESENYVKLAEEAVVEPFKIVGLLASISPENYDSVFRNLRRTYSLCVQVHASIDASNGIENTLAKEDTEKGLKWIQKTQERYKDLAEIILLARKMVMMDKKENE